MVIPNEHTAYPVVADPTVTLGWGVYIHYNRTDVHRVVSGLVGEVNERTKYAAVFCAFIPNTAAAAACGLFTYDVFSSIYDTFVRADRLQTCAFIHLVGPVPVGWNTEPC